MLIAKSHALAFPKSRERLSNGFVWRMSDGHPRPLQALESPPPHAPAQNELHFIFQHPVDGRALVPTSATGFTPGDKLAGFQSDNYMGWRFSKMPGHRGTGPFSFLYRQTNVHNTSVRLDYRAYAHNCRRLSSHLKHAPEKTTTHRMRPFRYRFQAKGGSHA